MKIIFLDVDGVLNSHQYLSRTDHDRDSGIYGDIDPEKVGLLRQIVEQTEAQIVLSSSWRELFYNGHPTETAAEHLVLALKAEGLILLDMTQSLQEKRDIEIRQWLSEHPEVENYVILDDDYHDWDELTPHWVRTSYYTGLTEQAVQDAIRILNGN